MVEHREHRTSVQGIKQPPDAELDVLACIYRQGQATASQVRQAIRHYRPLSHGAVATLLARLEARGLVTRTKAPVGKSFVYWPTRSARPAYKQIVRNMADRIFGGNSLEIVSTLLDVSQPTPDELAKLQQMLKDLQAKRKKQRED